MSVLYHITTREEAESAAARGEYVSSSFDREGFIHCSHSHQVLDTANRLFRGQRTLVLLEIDRERVPHAVIEENLEGGDELYPHIYGHLPISAVTAIHSFPCNADGTFLRFDR